MPHPRRRAPGSPQPPRDVDPAAVVETKAEAAQTEPSASSAPRGDNPPPPQKPQRLKITDLKDKSIQELTTIAKDLAVRGGTGSRTPVSLFSSTKDQTE